MLLRHDRTWAFPAPVLLFPPSRGNCEKAASVIWGLAKRASRALVRAPREKRNSSRILCPFLKRTSGIPSRVGDHGSAREAYSASHMVGLKNRWGDLLEDEEELPPTTTTGPDGKGLVVRVEYSRNDKGDVIKKTTKTKVVKIEKKVYKVRSLGVLVVLNNYETA